MRLLIFFLAHGLAAEPAPADVIVLGVFHMSNPGRDLHNLQVDDVLAPRHQAEIAAVTAALARFKPGKVAVEWPAGAVAERYAKYRAGTLAPSRDESVQLGFRLARTAGAQGVLEFPDLRQSGPARRARRSDRGHLWLRPRLSVAPVRKGDAGAEAHRAQRLAAK